MASSGVKPPEMAIFQILSPVRLPFRHTGTFPETLVAKGPEWKRELAVEFSTAKAGCAEPAGRRIKITFQGRDLEQLGRGGSNLCGRLMIWLVGAIEFQQDLILFQQLRFTRRRGQRAGFLRRRHRLVKSSRLGAGSRQSADGRSHAIVRQLAGAPGILDGSRTIPDVRIRTGRQQPGQIVQDIHGVGVDLQRPLVLDNRFIHPALLVQSVAKVEAGSREFGLDFQGLLVLDNRFVHLALFEKGDSEVVVGIRIVGFDLQRFLVMGNRFVHLALLEQRAAQVVLGFGVIRADLHRFLVMGDRFVHLALLEQRIAEVVVGSGVIGFDLHRLLVFSDRFVHLALLTQSVAEIVMAHVVARRAGERMGP